MEELLNFAVPLNVNLLEQVVSSMYGATQDPTQAMGTVSPFT